MGRFFPQYLKSIISLTFYCKKPQFHQNKSLILVAEVKSFHCAKRAYTEVLGGLIYERTYNRKKKCFRKSYGSAYQIRFSLTGLIFNSASKRQIKWNSSIHLERGLFPGGLITRCLFLFTGRWGYHLRRGRTNWGAYNWGAITGGRLISGGYNWGGGGL